MDRLAAIAHRRGDERGDLQVFAAVALRDAGAVRGIVDGDLAVARAEEDDRHFIAPAAHPIDGVRDRDQLGRRQPGGEALGGSEAVRHLAGALQVRVAQGVLGVAVQEAFRAGSEEGDVWRAGRITVEREDAEILVAAPPGALPAHESDGVRQDLAVGVAHAHGDRTALFSGKLVGKPRQVGIGRKKAAVEDMRGVGVVRRAGFDRPGGGIRPDGGECGAGERGGDNQGEEQRAQGEPACRAGEAGSVHSDGTPASAPIFQKSQKKIFAPPVS